MGRGRAQPGAGGDDAVEHPERNYELAAGVGDERLRRSSRDMLVTAVIGGVEVSLGALAAMTVLGSALDAWPGLHLYGGLALAGAVFPIGFLFVIVGRSELFTENFLLPVAAVLERRQPGLSLIRLYGLAWVGNLLGCGAMALMLQVPGAIGEPLHHGYAAYAAYKLSVPPAGIFLSAGLAGMTMTVMTWLLVAVRDVVARVLVIWGAGFTIFATNFSHAIVGAAILLAGFHDAHRTLGAVFVWLVITTLGNVAGGVGLVALGRTVQVRVRRRDRSRVAA